MLLPENIDPKLCVYYNLAYFEHFIWTKSIDIIICMLKLKKWQSLLDFLLHWIGWFKRAIDINDNGDFFRSKSLKISKAWNYKYLEFKKGLNLIFSN